MSAPPRSQPHLKDGVSTYTVRPGDTLWKIALERLGDPRLFPDLAKLNGIDDPDLIHVGEVLIVPDYTRYDRTMAFMYLEMLRNAQSAEAQQIFNLTRQAADAEAAGQKANAVRFTTEAFGRWYLLVRGPITAGGRQIAAAGPWDHKPQLAAMYRQMSNPPGSYGKLGKAFHFPIRGDVFHEFFYDVWSNIHYGYVGTRAGFSADTLQTGANVAAIPGVGDNDEGDRISIGIGIDLWNTYRLGLQEDHIRKAILAKTDAFIATRDQRRVVITGNDYK